MKRVIALLLALGAAALAQTDAPTTLKTVIANLSGNSLRATLTVRIERPDRRTRYVLRLIEDGTGRSLMRVLSPASEVGKAYLLDGENAWAYNPTLKRSLRLPPSGASEGFLGSDLGLNDLTARDLEQHYATRITTREPNLTLELTPEASAPTPYGKAVLEADPRSLALKTVTFYDQRGTPLRRLSLSEHARAGKHLVPTRYLIEDLTRPGYRTTAMLSEYEFGISLPDSCFKPDAMRGGC